MRKSSRVDRKPTVIKVSGFALLAVAVAGVFLGTKAPQRWGRPGGALLVGGLSVLLARDVLMITSGSLARLRPLPASLLLAESASAGTSIALGIRPLLIVTRTASSSLSVGLGTELARLTFAIHAVRQLIFLSPSSGLRAKSE